MYIYVKLYINIFNNFRIPKKLFYSSLKLFSYYCSITHNNLNNKVSKTQKKIKYVFSSRHMQISNMHGKIAKQINKPK